MMSDMLFDEEPLLVPRKLAKALGINEALIVQQIHYWVGKKLHFYDNRYWTYNTYEDWGKQFNHLSPRAIRRYVNKLEKMGILDSNRYNQSRYDRTKWYTIDYETLNSYRQKGADHETDLATSKVPKVVTSNLPKVDTCINTKNNTKNNTKKEEVESLFNKWNTFAKQHSLSQVIKLTDTRISHIKQRLEEEVFDFDKILSLVANSDFLLGKVKEWKVDFDFIIGSKNNYVKILEGKYNSQSKIVDFGSKAEIIKF